MDCAALIAMGIGQDGKRTSDPIERINEELKCRTRVASLFPDEASLLRLVTALLCEISNKPAFPTPVLLRLATARSCSVPARIVLGQDVPIQFGGNSPSENPARALMPWAPFGRLCESSLSA